MSYNDTANGRTGRSVEAFNEAMVAQQGGNRRSLNCLNLRLSGFCRRKIPVSMAVSKRSQNPWAMKLLNMKTFPILVASFAAVKRQ
jgi:hypothetical protein